MWLVAGTAALAGALDGTNRVFVAAQAFNVARAQLAINGLLRLPGQVTDNGYVISGRTVTLGEAPVARDVVALWAEAPGVAPTRPPAPPQGMATAIAPPTGSAQVARQLMPTGEAQGARVGPTGSVQVS